MKTNLLFIVFNRPHYLKETLKKINIKDFNQIYAFIDGPRENNLEDHIKTKEVKQLLTSHGIIKINDQKNNLGINLAFETAISWFFDNVESGVILEEDCVPDKSFFSFSAEMFEKYRNNKRIGMINGTNLHPSNQNSYLFSHHFGIWGWGTWRDRWQKYKRIKNRAEIKVSFKDLLKFTGSFAGALNLHTKFNRLTSKKMWFWDMNWTYTNVINNWLCIIPAKNLITNIGHFGNSSSKKTFQHDLTTDEIFPSDLIHPSKIEVDLDYDRYLDRNYNLLPSIKSFVHQLVNFKKFS